MTLDTYRAAGLPDEFWCDPRETRRHGFTMARLELVSADGIDPLDLRDQFLASDVEVLVVRVPSGGFDWPARLRHRELAVLPCDTLVYFRKDLSTHALTPTDTDWRTATPADAPALARMVDSTFEQYKNHYSANPIFDRDKVRAGVAEWAIAYIDGPFPQRCVWIRTDAHGEVVSFMSNELAEQGEIVLGGVNPAYRGRNAYEGLVGISERHFFDHGVMQSVISTQTTNRTVIRVWIRNGYQFDSAYTTLHLLKGRALHELDAWSLRADNRARV